MTPIVVESFIWVFRNSSKINLVRYVVLCALIAILALGLGVYFIGFWLEPLISWMIGLVPDTWEGAWVDWTVLIGTWIIRIFLFLLVFRHILAIIYAPLLGYLSEKVENQLASGIDTKIGFFASIWRGVKVNIRLLSKEILFAAPWLFLSFIPIVNVPSSVILFLTTSYYAGISSMDYTMERYHGIVETTEIINKNKRTVTMLGMVQVGMTLIPVVGLLIAPPICAAMGAYIYRTKWVKSK